MLIDKIYEIISPPPSISDQALQEACMKKKYLQSHPHPHLKGSLELLYKGTFAKKWVVILDRTLAIFTNPYSASPDYNIKIEDVADIVLVTNEKGLALKVEEGLVPYVFNANKVDEIIEWYHALCCCRHLILALGSDFLPLEVDTTELHVCNVKSSDEYVGEKVHEGVLRKQGLKWKVTRTRWFVLRSQALFYYETKNDKQCKKFFKLSSATKVE